MTAPTRKKAVSPSSRWQHSLLFDNEFLFTLRKWKKCVLSRTMPGFYSTDPDMLVLTSI
jgi:hypothetical protein